MMKKFLLILLVFISFLFSFVYANISVSPLKFEYTILPGESLSGVIKVTNTDESSVTLYSSKEDFVAGDDKGTPKFVPESDSSSNLFGLTNWLKINQENVTLSPGETREVAFSINVPVNGEPGGHYGAIFFTKGGGNGQVAITARLGVLILINVPGDVKVDGQLLSFNISQKENNNYVNKTDFDSLPVYFPVIMKNSGNVHIKPYGKITLIDDEGNVLKNVSKEPMMSSAGAYLGDKLVDYILVNTQDGNVLPNSQRIFEPVWSGFYYESINQDGAKELKYRTLDEYYKSKSKELASDLKFYQTIKQVNVKKKIIAQMQLSYEGKDGQRKDFNEQKEFYIQYKDSIVTLNIYIIILGMIVVVGLFYYIFIGRKNFEKKLKEKIMNEINNGK